ncbi:hypothetical protein LTR08_008739 [Meristemomyces frigidus]|nr:hypothetical protein LTR08_008739 [Meristemomyces frigidus]
MRFFTTLAFAGIAAGAVAKKMQAVGWDKYADERDAQDQVEAAHHGHVHAREAEAVWEHAHGGKAPTYKGFEHEHGQFVPRSVDEDEEEIDYSLEGYDHEIVARSDDEEEVDYSLEGYDHEIVASSDDEEEVDYSLEGYDHELAARSDIPDFGDEDVDTSLEGFSDTGLHARDVPDFEDEDEEIDTSLDGYSSTSGLHARDIPDFGEDDVDVSLEGYGEPHVHARSVPDFDEDEDVDTSLDGYSSTPDIHARDIPDFGDEDVDVSLEGFGDSHLQGRSEPNWDEQLSKWVSGHHTASAAHQTHPGHEHESTAWPKPTHVARAIKETWDHVSGQAEEAAEHIKHQSAGAPARGPRKNYARDAKGKLVYNHQPAHEEDSHDEHLAHYYAREAAANAEANAYRAIKAQALKQDEEHQQMNHHHVREAEPRNPIFYGNNQLLRQTPQAVARPLVARDAEPLHAHATSTRAFFTTKHTATKTATPSKTGGWGFPW